MADNLEAILRARHERHVRESYLYVAVTFGQNMADYLRDKFPTEVLLMVANGWTIESAINHIEGTCDPYFCTGEH